MNNADKSPSSEVVAIEIAFKSLINKDAIKGMENKTKMPPIINNDFHRCVIKYLNWLFLFIGNIR